MPLMPEALAHQGAPLISEIYLSADLKNSQEENKVGKRSWEHIKAQSDGKARDLFTCQICGRTDKSQGHHIIDVQFGGSSSVDNIITLCKNHHEKVHAGKISISKF